ncbi:MAG TPA: 4'-phosphopantetheinyl transferase superfamily protein [Planctomycetota bacterium]|nr:4'-phosphopantetheinyl transferase superfamily protein [Planctomycetota bacterium]
MSASQAASSVRIYTADARAIDAASLARLESLLDAAEAARAARFHFDLHRRRFVAAHGFLREVLARESGLEARALRFQLGPHGKPRLAESELHFNLTHTGEIALVAVGERELGLDAEEIRPERLDGPLAQRVMTAEEFSTWTRAPRAEQVRAFFRLWSAKESVMKAVGLGIGLAPQSFAVFEPHSLELRATTRIDDCAWTLRELTGPAGFAFALATQGPALVAHGAWP